MPQRCACGHTLKPERVLEGQEAVDHVEDLADEDRRADRYVVVVAADQIHEVLHQRGGYW
jgi:hypothetical protein